MSNITNINKIDGGWQYTLAAVPANGWDIWLAAVRLESRYASTTYKLFRTDVYPPAIEVVDPYMETPSFGSAGAVRLQWQHKGATYYIVERSGDGVTYARVGVVPGSGNVWHTFVFPGVNGRCYWKVFPAGYDDIGYYKTGYALPMAVDQSVLPVPPEVRVSYSATTGNLTIAALSAVRSPVGLMLDDFVTAAGSTPATYGGNLDDQIKNLQ